MNTVAMERRLAEVISRELHAYQAEMKVSIADVRISVQVIAMTPIAASFTEYALGRVECHIDARDRFARENP